jgi:hypothetical protein
MADTFARYFLELLGVHEADRSSGMIEDTHYLARHVMCDDWALCAATAQEIAEVADFIVEPSGLKGLVKFHGASIDVPDGRMNRVALHVEHDHQEYGEQGEARTRAIQVS